MQLEPTHDYWNYATSQDLQSTDHRPHALGTWRITYTFTVHDVITCDDRGAQLVWISRIKEYITGIRAVLIFRWYILLRPNSALWSCAPPHTE
jgi:hypothetical protein